MRNHKIQAGFTLVELIVVIGIIVILIGLLMPAMVNARRNAQATQCASNLRQLSTAMLNYAAEFKGAFPPNIGAVYTFWTSTHCIGRYVKSQLPSTDDTIAGGVMRCPADREDAVRCYSMNLYASSAVSATVEASLKQNPPGGRLWKLGVPNSSHMILLIEAFATEDWPTWDQPSAPPGWKPLGLAAPAVVGWRGRPAERLGYGDGFQNNGIYGAQAAQICYYRHRTGKVSAGLGDAYGKLNIGFADGHVQLHSHTDLVDWNAGKSTYQAMWSPIDREID